VVRARGYAGRTFPIDLKEDPATFVVRLGRLIGFCLIRERGDLGCRYSYLTPVALHLASYQDWMPWIEARIDAEWHVKEPTYLEWRVWAEQGGAPVLESVQALVQQPNRIATPFEIPVKPLTDPDFHPIPFPCTETQAAEEVLLRILPAEAFLDSPPAEIHFDFRKLDGRGYPAAVFPLTGRRADSGDTLYKFWVPPGRYQVETSKQVMPALLGMTPDLAFQPIFEVTAGRGPVLLDLFLHPQERYLEYRFTDVQGFPVEINALLVNQWPFFPKHTSRGFSRFVRLDRTYTLVGRRFGGMGLPILDGISPPGHLRGRESWRLVVPEALLGPKDGLE